VVAVDLQSNIRQMKGIGEKRAALYEKLGVVTVEDLLGLYPRRYIDYGSYIPLTDAVPGEVAAIKATLVKKQNPVRISGGRILYRAVAADGLNNLNIVFFNNKFALMFAQEGRDYIFYGKVTGKAIKEMVSPTFIAADDPVKLYPVYPQTTGLSSHSIVKDVKQAYKACQEYIEDIFPDNLRVGHQLCHKSFAVKTIHFPENEHDYEVAKKRLAFEELLVLQLALSKLKVAAKKGSAIKLEPVDMEPFYNSLPFPLTQAQRRSIDEGIADLHSGVVMNRLVQGDVGSGKTMVAAALAYYLIKSGYQAAMMAPTEILAKQHFTTFIKLFDRFGFRCELLTGSMTAKQRREAAMHIETGMVDFVVGTHAVISGSTRFYNLGLVVTDEQHRFGVRQRAMLSEKGEQPHTLVMSATPIPRTLALILYGDLDISIIDELPPGRQQVDTVLIRSSKRERALGFVKDLLDKGLQAYIICPLVEEGEEELGDLKSVTQYGQDIAENELAGYPVGILHGKMKPKDKDLVMERFVRNELGVLVSTTVVEVGVDVPNAVVMMIENAERFGLSQLHQLRGRVGRGREKSYCILISDSNNEVSITRLGILTKTNDGFRLAEEDLKLRGPGDFFGNRQHGLPTLKVANMLTDSKLLRVTSDVANEILQKDPQLITEEYKGLAGAVERLFGHLDGTVLN